MALVRISGLKDFRSSTNRLSTTGVGTAYQIGPRTATQKLYGGLQLTSASLGTTSRVLAMSIQSASSSGFSSLTSAIQFTRSTAAGAEWGTPNASISTDQPWVRASWTLSTAASTAGTWAGLVWAGIR